MSLSKQAVEPITVENQPTLVKLPAELLHHIISFVSARFALKRLLCVNKLLSSIAVDHLYGAMTDVAFGKEDAWLRTLFQSYCFRTCYYPYYTLLRKLDVSHGPGCGDDVQKLVMSGALSQSSRVRHLHFTVDDDFRFPAGLEFKSQLSVLKLRVFAD